MRRVRTREPRISKPWREDQFDDTPPADKTYIISKEMAECVYRNCQDRHVKLEQSALGRKIMASLIEMPQNRRSTKQLEELQCFESKGHKFKKCEE